MKRLENKYKPGKVLIFTTPLIVGRQLTGEKLTLATLDMSLNVATRSTKMRLPATRNAAKVIIGTWFVSAHVNYLRVRLLNIRAFAAFCYCVCSAYGLEFCNF